MNRSLLLILLFSWSLSATHACDNAVAKQNSQLSVPKSLRINADVALLKKFGVDHVEKCLEDCCVKKYGNCNIATYRKNATEENCLHFYCLPTNKCEFTSSNSSDSFLFSSSAFTSPPVPSLDTGLKNNSGSPPPKAKQSSSAPQQALGEREVTKEKIVTYSEEQFALKNDNKTIKPRKGVEDPAPDDPLDAMTRSGVKPRKGVTMEDPPRQESLSTHAKSKVKPRKGVGPYDETSASTDFSTTHSSSSVRILSTATIKDPVVQTSVNNKYAHILSNDLISALEKVFEDDPHAVNTSSNSTVHEQTDIPLTTTVAEAWYPSYQHDISSSVLLSSYSLHHDSSELTSKHTPTVKVSSVMAATYFDDSVVPTSVSAASRSVVVSSEVVEMDPVPSWSVSEDDDQEAENERRYKSSMHLVLSLVFGLLVLFTVLGVVAKRIYDGWLRRHYRRMDFLIDGMYNGYG